ncbi:condensation domain-containing protein, partial [Kitasatospora sp. NPDC051170]|uniref:condensation domain-containing protein n=1 Tax=Kitasatospora sp. NPDC051170 TaxID=3364056 RepID=UPI0037B17CA5
MVASEAGLRELMTGQLGIWYGQQLAPDSPAYNVGECLELRGGLEPGLFLAALRRTLDEAEAYRLRFRVQDGTPRQYVDGSPDHPIHVLDLSAEPDARAAADAWMRADLDRPVDLTAGPSHLHALITLGPDHHLWYQRTHHAVIDGSGLMAFADRLAHVYTALLEGRAPEDGALPPLALLLDADRDYRASADHARDGEYWRTTLAGHPLTTAPDRPRRPAGSQAPVLHTADLDPAAAAALKAAARRLRTSFATLMIAAAAVHRHRVTGSRDTLVGVAVAGRTGLRERRVPGMTSSIMPVRLSLTPGTTVADLVGRTAAAVADGLRHQRYQYTDIVGDLKLVGGAPLCDLVVNVISADRALRFGDCTVERTALASGPTDGLRIDVYPRASGAGIRTAVVTNRDPQDPEAGAAVSARYARILDWLANAEPTDPVAAVELLGEDERRHVLSEWNAAPVETARAHPGPTPGEPSADARAYVLDTALRPSPVGAVGELYLAGSHLTAGHLEQAGPTAQRFVACPYGSGARMYRTGEQARWTADGRLEVLGETTEPPARPVGEPAPRTGRGPSDAREELLCALFAEALDLPSVGVDDDFFALGGQSLSAIRLLSRVREALGVTLPVRALFLTPTVAGLAASAGRQPVPAPANLIPDGATAITPEMLPLVELSPAEIERVVAGVHGGAANVADVYPLAPVQEGILFHHRLAGGAEDAYVTQTVLEFDTRAGLDAFAKALQTVVDRHDVFRTGVVWEGLEEPVQVVWRTASLPVTEVALAAGEPDPVAALLAAGGLAMDLGRAPLMDLHVAADPHADRWLAYVRIHHLIEDHTAIGVLLAEVRAVLEGRTAELPAPLPFRDFVAGVRTGAGHAADEKYFADLLGDVDEPTAPFGLVDVHRDGSDSVQARVALEPDLVGRVRTAARRLGASPATLLHLAWARVLASVSGRSDVVFGTVLFGRMNAGAGADRVPGPFMNMLPVRVPVDGTGVRAAVAGMRGQLAELLEHEHAALALAQRVSGIPGNAPLFTSIFNYRHNTAGQDVNRDGLGIEGVGTIFSRARNNYPLTAFVEDDGSGIGLTVDAVAPVDPLEVCTLLRTALDGLIGALETELDGGPEQAFNTVRVLGGVERHRVLVEWNDTGVAGVSSLVPELFAARVAESPDAVAVVCDGVEVSFAELDERASRLAWFLVGQGIGAESVVGLCLPRGVDMVVGILGVWRAGAAYVPVDPEYPVDRIAFVLRDSGAVVLIGSSEVLDDLPAGGVRMVALDDPFVRAELAGLPGGVPGVSVLPGNVAYVVYTSGSTGLPKGV